MTTAKQPDSESIHTIQPLSERERIIPFRRMTADEMRRGEMPALPSARLAGGPGTAEYAMAVEYPFPADLSAAAFLDWSDRLRQLLQDHAAATVPAGFRVEIRDKTGIVGGARFGMAWLALKT